VSFWTLLVLGLVAGGTIFIGLLLGRLRGLSSTLRTALSMLAAGILVFLLVEILEHAIEQTASSTQDAAPGITSASNAGLLIFLLLGGFFVGFFSLVGMQQTLIRRAAAVSPVRLSLMIAAAIGLHNFSEGLAIGQSAAQGMATLALGLMFGFAVHNATEGFGILSPLVREKNLVPWSTLLLLGTIGGGPTFVGTLLGGLWTSVPLSVFLLALAGGALLYVLKELVAKEFFSKVQRREVAQALTMIMIPLILGIGIGWCTEQLAEGATAGAGHEELE
jgi:ZIP family zinc transporter